MKSLVEMLENLIKLQGLNAVYSLPIDDETADL